MGGEEISELLEWWPFTLHDEEPIYIRNSVHVKTSDSDFFALVTKVENRREPGGMTITLRRYFRPEDTKGGRHTFYGRKELLLTDHVDTVKAWDILHKIKVRSLFDYTKLKTVGEHDYFRRFEYEIGCGCLSPSIIDVYCKCLMPFNPDDFMLKCEACKERYHPACINITDVTTQLDKFTCSDCLTPDNDGSASACSSADPWMVEHKQARWPF